MLATERDWHNIIRPEVLAAHAASMITVELAMEYSLRAAARASRRGLERRNLKGLQLEAASSSKIRLAVPAESPGEVASLVLGPNLRARPMSDAWPQCPTHRSAGSE
jgi:hypothetical protein